MGKLPDRHRSYFIPLLSIHYQSLTYVFCDMVDRSAICYRLLEWNENYNTENYATSLPPFYNNRHLIIESFYPFWSIKKLQLPSCRLSIHWIETFCLRNNRHVGAVVWQDLRWYGYNFFFGIFRYLAPCSYVIYISHDYLVINATYLRFIHNSFVEYGLYIVFMIIFSYFLEVVVYNRIKKKLIG